MASSQQNTDLSLLSLLSPRRVNKTRTTVASSPTRHNKRHHVVQTVQSCLNSVQNPRAADLRGTEK